MPTYTLVPDEHDYDPEEIVADGPGELLTRVYGYGWNKAQVLEDGRFLFIVARNVEGVWAILPGLAESEERA